MKNLVPLSLTLIASLRCSEDAGVAVPRNIPVPSCPSREEAPLPDGRGGVTCLPVGADTVPATRATPALDGAPTPILHVLPGAAGGDGSEARPFGSLPEALSRLTAGGTLALHRGEFRVDAALTIPSGVTVVGVGPTAGTALVVTRGHAGLVIAANVTVRDLALRYEDGVARAEDAAMDVPTGTSLSLRNVLVEGAYEGLRVSGSVTAERLSVRRAARNGVALVGAASGRFRGLLVRDGDHQGVFVGPQDGTAGPAGHVQITDAAVLDNALRGVVLLGAAARGGGAAECTLDGPSSSSGDLDCLTRVSIERNGAQALGVQGARAVQLRRVSLSGTRAVGTEPDADGLVVSDGARVTLDDPESAMMSTPAAPRPGLGSIIVGNARVGVLADGAGADLSLSGARVQSNRNAGVLVTGGANARTIGYCRVDDNRAVGVGVTSTGTVVSIQCNGITGTLAAPLTGSRPSLGDGLSITRGGAGVVIADNEMTGNDRFGAVLSAASGTFRHNRGSDNLYAIGVYDSPMLTVIDNDTLTGRAPAPATAPALAGSP